MPETYVFDSAHLPHAFFTLGVWRSLNRRADAVRILRSDVIRDEQRSHSNFNILQRNVV